MIIAKNRKAHYDYEIESSYESGIILIGIEVKALRNNLCQLQDSYCEFINNELYVKNMYIPCTIKDEKSDTYNPSRDRKLLLNRTELNKIDKLVSKKGMTIIPLEVYFLKSYCKVKIGICRGKKLYDKRETIKERDIQRSMSRNISD